MHNIENEGNTFLMDIQEQRALVLEQLQCYPFNMQPKDVAEFLNLSLSSVYKLINDDNVPILNLIGRRLKIIPKAKFVDWYIEKTNKTYESRHMNNEEGAKQ